MSKDERHFPVSIEIPVAWGEMDALNHVNNVVYFRYFETVRIEYLRRIGMLDVLSTQGVGPVLAETSARYRRPVTFPDTLTAQARVSQLDEHGFTMEYRIVSQAQQTVTTEGSARVVMVDFGSGRKAPLGEELKQRLLQLEG
ncbi:thioesterase [Zobellella endophytica]|uniref:Thioesterase n=1 Tax=Zobellella endophytica TaxID=2116700 RepID=A0A2P7QTQ8_9GAMM|nr:thioesterase family protein [Zobellella endophytica]PSJ41338.1 thioesterase [Zobellella endophytica]